MALFSGKIEKAYYISEDYSVVEVIYTDDNGNKVNHALEVNENHPDYKDLLAEDWDEERLFIETAEYKRDRAASFNQYVNDAAKILLAEKFDFEDDIAGAEKKKDSFTWDEFFTSMNNDKDEIFKFKIWAFESDKLKGASAQLKRDLRKAPSLLDAMTVYGSVT